MGEVASLSLGGSSGTPPGVPPNRRIRARLLRAVALLAALVLAPASPAAADDAPASPPDVPAALSMPAPAEPVAEPPRQADPPDPPDAPAAPAASAASAASAAPRKVSSRATPSKRRGGINPCMTPDPGWGVYESWSRAPSMGQMIIPHKGGITKSGGFDVLIHFHGHEPVRKEFVKNPSGIVLVGIDLGIGSGAYANAFASPHVFERLLESIEAAVAKKTGKKNARIRKLGLSAWSAGYGAIEQILRQPLGKKVDSIVLLDSLHAGYADEQARTLKTLQIEPFVQFARRAAAGKGFMFMSHSSIIPPGYASTTEVVDHVVKQLKGKPKSSKRKDVLGLDMIRRYDRGNFHARGYTGEDKPDHCAHIGLIADVVRVHLQKRWKTPKGRR